MSKRRLPTDPIRHDSPYAARRIDRPAGIITCRYWKGIGYPRTNDEGVCRGRRHSSKQWSRRGWGRCRQRI